MRSNIVFVAPSLGPDVIAMTKILERANLLGSLVTRIVVRPAMSRVLERTSVTKSFSRRPGSPASSTRTDSCWLADLVFHLVFVGTQSRSRATDASFRYLDRYAAKRISESSRAVLAREDSCLATFSRAKQLGVKKIYQLPTAYWRLVHELMEREVAQFPGVCRVGEDSYEFARERTERKNAELDLADQVLCPSTFVYQSLVRYRPGAYKVIPFGVDGPGSTDQIARKPVILYAGNITMRKGVHRLLLAWKRLKAYRTHELRLIGDMFLSKKFLSDFRGMFTHIPRLSSEELDQQYREASTFVFNSVADGFGHVILEAMSNRVPVIASRNCGGPDVIESGNDGLLIDYGVDDQLDNALEWALTHPTELSELGDQGFRRVQRWTWNDYAKEFLNWIQSILG